MKSMRVNPTMNPVNWKLWKGLNQSALGTKWPGGAFPDATFTRATIENRNRIVSSIPSSAFCILADISIPT